MREQLQRICDWYVVGVHELKEFYNRAVHSLRRGRNLVTNGDHGLIEVNTKPLYPASVDIDEKLLEAGRRLYARAAGGPNYV